MRRRSRAVGASGFDTAVLDWTDDYGLEYDWKPAPGWLANQQGNSKFHHFHWPAFAINSDQLGSGWCTVREKGTAPQNNTNPGGVLTIKENHGHWGRHGQWVAAYPLLDRFMEGNGNAAAGARGAGMGVTWNCAQDLDISNDEKECLFERTGMPCFRPRWNEPSAAVKHFNDTTGPVEWDVTEDVVSGITAWILQKTKRWRGGSVDYHSRQGARAANDTTLAPTLLLER